MDHDPSIEATRRLAHDLRNVLVSLQSVATAIERALAPRDAGLALDLALAVERAASLARQLADVGVDAPRVPDARRCGVAATLRRCKSLLAHVASPVAIELGGGVPTGEIRLSEESLERIAINLVRNARRAAGAEGVIAVTMHRAWDPTGAAFDTLTVDNPALATGCRLAQLPSHEIPFGLGLTIVRELTESAGGRIEAWHADGTLVRVACVFPLAEPPASND